MNRNVVIGAAVGLGVAACIVACAKSGRCQSDSTSATESAVDATGAEEPDTGGIATPSNEEALVTAAAR